MVTSKSRFPTRQEILQVFAICAVPIHVWAFIALFRAVPSWVLSMTLWEMVGVVAYPLTFALLESLLLLAALLAGAVLLPRKLYRQWFVSQSVLAVLLAVAWAVLIQINGQEWGMWSTRGIMTLVPLFLAICVLAFLNARFKPVQKAAEVLAERLVILGVLYLGIDLVFALIFVARNIL